MLFNGEAKLGFTDACSVKANCAADEVCVARISDPNQGHIADCDDNTMPMPNAFANKICCSTPKEYCRDGIDNNGNGLIDCADPECHPSALTFDTPQQCDPDPLTPPGNNQTTLDCVSFDALGDVVYSPHCLYGVDPYYCSYGTADDPSVPPGYCCPAGERAVQNLNTGEWSCVRPTQCGIFDIPCFSDFRFNRTSWIDNLFLGDTNNWCHSALPLLTDHILPSSFRSEACCPVLSYGTLGFYIIDSNVKIFGSD